MPAIAAKGRTHNTFPIKGYKGQRHELTSYSHNDTIGELQENYQSKYGLKHRVVFVFQSKIVAAPDMPIGYYTSQKKEGEDVFLAVPENDHEAN